MNISTFYYFLDRDGAFATNFKVRICEQLSITETQTKGYEILKNLQKHSKYIIDFISFQLCDMYDPDEHLKMTWKWYDSGGSLYRTAGECAAAIVDDPSIDLDIQLLNEPSTGLSVFTRYNDNKPSMSHICSTCGKVYKRQGWLKHHRKQCR